MSMADLPGSPSPDSGTPPAPENPLREFPDIVKLCEQGKVEKARRLLAGRRMLAKADTRRKIDLILSEPRYLLAPIKSAPTLYTLNSLGAGLYGSRAEDPRDGTYVATQCFCALFIPLIPIASYLVRKNGTNGWVFFGRVPLSGFARWWRRTVVGGALLLGFGAYAFNAYDSSDYIRESRHLSAAEDHLGQDNLDLAVSELMQVTETRDEGRREKVKTLGHEVLLKAVSTARTPSQISSFLSSTGSTLRSANASSWFADDVLGAIEEGALAASTCPEGGTACRDLVDWASDVNPAFRDRRPAIGVKACGSGDDVALLAATVRWHLEAKLSCPAELLRRLGGVLGRKRHAAWDSDTLLYLRAADPDEARPILFARAEAAWKGEKSADDLIPVADRAPPPLKTLIELDAERELAKRAKGLEAIAEPEALPEPQALWHRLGVARRLSEVYSRLNLEDPIAFPSEKAAAWAIRAAELAPEDPDLRERAVRALVQGGEFDRAIALAEKFPSDPRTTTWLGIAYARAGRPEDARRILSPCVTEHLGAYVQAFDAWQKGVSSLQESLLQTLRNGTADQAFIARLNAMSDEESRIAVDNWLRQRFETDPALSNLEAAWRAHGDVYPAATELAMTELMLGRSLPPGEGRKAHLTEAERIFLELRKVSEDDPTQELQLGQVYFWLGKEQEGQEIFDRLEKAGDGEILLDMGEIHRNLGRTDAARRVLEAAYGKLTDRAKERAALLRAITNRDLEDRVAWLGKCSAADPYVKSSMDEATGELHLQKGEWSEAVPPLQAAVGYYARQPVNMTTLNNASILQSDLYYATGDAKYLKEALRLQRQASDLAKDDAIVLTNYVEALQKVGYAALVGDALKTELLHEAPSRSWLYFVRPEPSMEQWAERAKGQAELRRSSELGERVAILAADRDTGYDAQVEYLALTRNVEGLRRLRELVEASPPSSTERIERAKAIQRGEIKPEDRRAAERALTLYRKSLEEIRRDGHGPTLAFALDRLSQYLAYGLEMGIGDIDLDEGVRYADEAAATFGAGPCHGTAASLHRARASRLLAGTDAEYRRWTEATPRLDGILRLWLYVDTHPEAAEAVRKMEDVKVAGEAMSKGIACPSSTVGPYDWACLDLAGHPGADAARKRMVEEGVMLDLKRVHYALNPQSSAGTFEALICARAFGDKAFLERLTAESRRRKILPEYFGE